MRLRTKGEQKAYLDGYERCAESIKQHLSDKGKNILECHLTAVNNAYNTAINSLENEQKLKEAVEKIKEEIKVIRDRECSENDSFDEYSEGRYDVACECLRIIDKYLSAVSE